MSFSSKGRNLFNECFEWYFSKKMRQTARHYLKIVKHAVAVVKLPFSASKNDDDKSLSIFICNRVELFLN